jgi:hypothetical protein
MNAPDRLTQQLAAQYHVQVWELPSVHGTIPTTPWGCSPSTNQDKLLKPPNTESITIHWAQLAYSLRLNPRTGQRVKYGTVRQLQSAANMYYMIDALLARPSQAMKIKNRLNLHMHVLPPDEAMLSFATKGMEGRLGHTSKPSWALSWCTSSSWMNSLRPAGTLLNPAMCDCGSS